jgi:hypothetical protein
VRREIPEAFEDVLDRSRADADAGEDAGCALQDHRARTILAELNARAARRPNARPLLHHFAQGHRLTMARSWRSFEHNARVSRSEVYITYTSCGS